MVVIHFFVCPCSGAFGLAVINTTKPALPSIEAAPVLAKLGFHILLTPPAHALTVAFCPFATRKAARPTPRRISSNICQTDWQPAPAAMASTAATSHDSKKLS